MKPVIKFPLLFDGAMGTWYSRKTRRPAWEVDLSVLDRNSPVPDMHREYLRSGARAIKTCTFSLPELQTSDPAKASAVLKSAVEMAREAVAREKEEGTINEHEEVFVFADLGPLPDHANPQKVYEPLFKQFIELGIDCFLFETLAQYEPYAQAAELLKNLNPDAFCLMSFAVAADGLSSQGIPARILLGQADEDENLDAIGLNCKCGPVHMESLVRDLPAYSKPLSIMPNAGYPSITSRSALYDGSPEYFALNMERILHEGAQIVGGCCGTEPAHIAMLAQVLKNEASANEKRQEGEQEQNRARSERDNQTDSANVNPQHDEHREKDASHIVRKEPGILEKRKAEGRKAILVELDPPANDRISRFLEGAARLHAAGADVLTIADNPIGRPRADSSILACKVHRELGIDVLPHMTCRDRNLNAIKALLLGLSIEGLHHVLLVTGDPLPLESRQDVKAVFSFNSRTLAGFVEALGEDETCAPFHTFGALDINAVNFDMQLRIAKQKELSGMEGFLTQPAFSKRALDNLKRARNELRGQIYGGIMPIVSYRNACFLKNEITGMDVPEEVCELYKDRSREECEEISLEFCQNMALKMQDDVDGYYLMTPFQRVELMEKLIASLKAIGD